MEKIDEIALKTGYYVKKYNLQLPKEFEDKILKTYNKNGIREDGR